jgi:hypothetical protein
MRSIMTIEWLIELARWYIYFLEELLDSLKKQYKVILNLNPFSDICYFENIISYKIASNLWLIPSIQNYRSF